MPRSRFSNDVRAKMFRELLADGRLRSLRLFNFYETVICLDNLQLTGTVIFQSLEYRTYVALDCK